MKSTRLKIVVTGLAAGYPFGGVFWDYIQYLIGFAELGHDVLYLEDTGRWCYSPVQQTFVESGADNARVLDESLRRLGGDYADRWHYRDTTGATFGRSADDTERFCREADLFLNISAAAVMRDEYRAAQVVGFVDSDPLYTQASSPDCANWGYDVYYTFGENLGSTDCAVPLNGCTWHPTRQPITMSAFEGYRVAIDQRRDALTTVASWEPHEKGPEVDGVRYHGKSVEFLRFAELPGRIDRPMELAMSGPVPEATMRGHGWTLIPANDISYDPWVYRDYLAHSWAEWSVAKHAYVASRSGWFSCRSACYLALGVPVIVQDTGFSRLIPSGRGLLAFDTADEAVAAVESIESDYAGHAEAARELASEYFDASKVLTRLIDTAAAAASTGGV